MDIHGGNFRGDGSHLGNLPGSPGGSCGSHTRHTHHRGTACPATAGLSSPGAGAAWNQSGHTQSP